MKLIKPNFNIIEQKPGIEGIYKIIEQAGRTCYVSTDRITEDSAKKFVKMLNVRHHLSVYEHGTVYLKINFNYIDISEKYDIPILPDIILKYVNNKYTKTVIIENSSNYTAYITTNYRTIVENKWEDDLQYLCEPTEYHEKRVTVHFVSDIHFYKDITRHRPMSYAIESTRFCNYIKEKFGNSISFATPIWLKEEEELEFEEDLKVVENLYFKWIKKGWQPQQAAYFLIQGTKADIVMTGFVSDFMHVFNLRTSKATTGKAHPSVIELFDPLYEEFIKRGYI